MNFDSLSGSSPLTRGKPAVQAWAGCVERLIPAHAGKTPRCASTIHCTRAHPRSRGENQEEASGAGLVDGSSPLTRGKQASDRPFSADFRLIPAHAGKTTRYRRCAMSRRAHPRSRGENELRAKIDQFNQGSSPLTRGKPVSVHEVGRVRGLIPAHAGKTLRGTSRPRTGPGSSPLTRGKPRAGP